MLAVLAALVLAQEIVPTAPSEVAPPPPPPPPVSAPAPAAPSIPPGDLSTSPPLPDGPLAPVARSDKGETFLVVDRASLTGTVADFWTYEAFIPPIEIRPGVTAVQGLAHHQVDCLARTDQTVAQAGYDEAGDPVVALAAGPPAPMTAGSAYSLIADAVCHAVKLPKADQMQGHAAALAAARAPDAG
ncbi:MAG: hypothetical protein ACREEB_09810 [Caulobacteraceae bacterium]